MKGDSMTYQEAIEQLDREERFKATIAAINALLIQKGVYSSEEFEAYFLETARPRIKRQAQGAATEPRQ